MTTSDNLPQKRWRSWILWLLVAGCTGLRIVLLPADDPSVRGFSDDSAYIARLAQNLLAGRGYVNDAHWLVFLRPESLPMPYHNANPLYATLIAAVSWLTGKSVIQSGFLISALASSAVLALLMVLLGKYVRDPVEQSLLAVAGALFSPAFEISLNYLPDALWLAFLMALAACVIRTQGCVGAGVAGLSLAWPGSRDLRRSLSCRPSACISCGSTGGARP